MRCCSASFLLVVDVLFKELDGLFLIWILLKLSLEIFLKLLCMAVHMENTVYIAIYKRTVFICQIMLLVSNLRSVYRVNDTDASFTAVVLKYMAKSLQLEFTV